MNAHNEKWFVDQDMVDSGDYSSTDSEGYCVITAYSNLEDDAGDTHSLARLKLATAAPLMARALLRVARMRCAAESVLGRPCAEETPGDDCGVCQARAALTAAGVPLP